jgi:hypothetical protein
MGAKMLQIFLITAQPLSSKRAQGILKEIDGRITDIIQKKWKVPENDIAFSAVQLAYARGGADVQIEIRYTAGTDEYDRGSAFDPSEEEQTDLCIFIAIFVKAIFDREKLNLTVSAWCKPFRGSVFKMRGK